MDSESMKLQFPVLSSKNYRSWSITMKLVLASKDLVEYIDSNLDDLIDVKTRELTLASTTPEVVVATVEDGVTPPSPLSTSVLSVEDKKAIDTAMLLLKQGNAKAMALIAVRVGPDQLSYIANAKTAFEQWSSLKRVYEPVGAAQLAALLGAFHGYSYRPRLRVDKVASNLTTLQLDIRMIDAREAPTDNAKLVTLTEMLLRSNS
jgi:hypothetical protein